MSLDLSSFVPAITTLCIDVLANPANRRGVLFIVASLAVSFGVLRPRRRHCSELHRDLDLKLQPLLSHQYISEEDLLYVEKTRRLVLTLPAPIHSDFLVTACISYFDENGDVQDVVGMNSETCILPSSLCAERSALAQVGRATYYTNRVESMPPCDLSARVFLLHCSFECALRGFEPSAPSTSRPQLSTACSSRRGCCAERCCRSTAPQRACASSSFLAWVSQTVVRAPSAVSHAMLPLPLASAGLAPRPPRRERPVWRLQQPSLTLWASPRPLAV